MKENNLEPLKASSSITVKRITAIWALSETTFGGLLHALHIPLTGIFIGGAAVVFITLIAYFSEERYSIVKATVIVLILKGIVSPYTPVTAYFSVLLQGILGQIIFGNKKHISLSAFALGVTTLTIFGFQKVLILTIVFGQTLWQSIDSFTYSIADQFNIGTQNSPGINLSFILISIYVLVHFTAGIFIGIMAGRIPGWLTDSVDKNNYIIPDIRQDESSLKFFNVNKKRSLRKKKKAFVFAAFAGTVLVISYFIPGANSNLFSDVVIMIIRAVIITIIWYFYLAPLLIYYTRRFLKKRQSNYTAEVEEIMALFPELKNVLLYCWNKTSGHKGLRKYRLFLSHSLITLLLTNIDFE